MRTSTKLLSVLALIVTATACSKNNDDSATSMKMEKAAEAVKEKSVEMGEAAQDMAESAASGVESAAEDVRDEAAELAEKTMEAAEDAEQAAREKANELAEAGKQKLNQ